MNCLTLFSNQSTENADEGGCLKFYRLLELLGFYIKILKKKATHEQYTVATFLSFSVFSSTTARATLLTLVLQKPLQTV